MATRGRQGDWTSFLRAEDERSFDPDVMDQNGGEIAGYHHQAESQSISSVHEVWLLCTTSTKRVHSSPDAWSGEIAQA